MPAALLKRWEGGLLLGGLLFSLFLSLLGSLLLGRSLLCRLFLGSSFGRLFLVLSQQFFAAHLVVGDIDLGEQMVNDLLLIERCANACESLRVLSVELEDLLLLVSREAADRVEQSALHLFFRDLHA